MGYRLIPYLRIMFMLAFTLASSVDPEQTMLWCGVGSRSTRFALNTGISKTKQNKQPPPQKKKKKTQKT